MSSHSLSSVYSSTLLRAIFEKTWNKFSPLQEQLVLGPVDQFNEYLKRKHSKSHKTTSAVLYRALVGIRGQQSSRITKNVKVCIRFIINYIFKKFCAFYVGCRCLFNPLLQVLNWI